MQAQHVPTLTEEVDLGAASGTALRAQERLGADAEALVARIVTCLEARLDAGLELRVNATIAPLMATAMAEILAAVRAELGRDIQVAVSEAVAEELSRTTVSHKV